MAEEVTKTNLILYGIGQAVDQTGSPPLHPGLDPISGVKQEVVSNKYQDLVNCEEGMVVIIDGVTEADFREAMETYYKFGSGNVKYVGAPAEFTALIAERDDYTIKRANIENQAKLSTVLSQMGLAPLNNLKLVDDTIIGNGVLVRFEFTTPYPDLSRARVYIIRQSQTNTSSLSEEGTDKVDIAREFLPITEAIKKPI